MRQVASAPPGSLPQHSLVGFKISRSNDSKSFLYVSWWRLSGTQRPLLSLLRTSRSVKKPMMFR